MRITARGAIVSAALVTFITVLPVIPILSQQPTFRNAPVSATAAKNPYAGNATAASAGKDIYAKSCTQCHGKNREGMGPAPPLDSEKVRSANSGELFWFITNGNPSSGMPAWPNLSKQQRWQVVAFLQSAAK